MGGGVIYLQPIEVDVVTSIVNLVCRTLTYKHDVRVSTNASLDFLYAGSAVGEIASICASKLPASI